uniref:Uncharacterized protein n=1 Tax=Archaeoglobus fulgidus TaxID=2234 RepID=A0A7J3M0H5_ARCFL
MGLAEVYKEFVNLLQLSDDERKAKAIEEFFRKLNTMQLPDYFNWAEEVFEEINVKKRRKESVENTNTSTMNSLNSKPRDNFKIFYGYRCFLP